MGGPTNRIQSDRNSQNAGKQEDTRWMDRTSLEDEVRNQGFKQ